MTTEKLQSVGIKLAELMEGTAFVLVVFDPLNPANNKTLTNSAKPDSVIRALEIVIEALKKK